MNERPTFESIYMKLAESIAQRSTCSRLQVGCVITSNDFRYVYGVGYNGSGSGLLNQCDNPDRKGNCGCLHAEVNASINCTANRNSDKVVFVTHLPCAQCAKALLNLGGVKILIYKNEYRNNTSIELVKNKMAVRQISIYE